MVKKHKLAAVSEDIRCDVENVREEKKEHPKTLKDENEVLESPPKTKKHKKKKNRDNQMNDKKHIGHSESSENDVKIKYCSKDVLDGNALTDLKGKKRKIKKGDILQKMDDSIIGKKSKKDKYEGSSCKHEELIADDEKPYEEEPKKKKHRHSKMCEELENGLEGKKYKKKKKRKTNIDEESGEEVNCHEKKLKEMPDGDKSLNGNHVGSSVLSSDKKQRKNGAAEVISESDSGVSSSKRKKKNKKSKHISEDDAGRTGEGTKRKKAKKTEQQPLANGVNGADEKARETNGSTGCGEESSGSNAAGQDAKSFQQGFRQWNSADLGSSERKQKFLKLMGGFKQSNSPQVETIQMKMLNIAMGSSSQMSYATSLEQEFEKARDISFFGPKGGGLGYTPRPGYDGKLHINPMKSRSIKFDD